MPGAWTRQDILPEPDLPSAGSLVAEGKKRAEVIRVEPGAFLNHHKVPSEIRYKLDCMARNQVMIHVQIGYRDPIKSREAFRNIHRQVSDRGGRVDRYGICLDWSMGYRREDRDGRPRGTGLILNGVEDFRSLCDAAPVAPHFGDFVLGMPSALENTEAALLAGSTAIGNIGQYFAFRMPHYDDDVDITGKTVTALALCAAQPVPVLVHSNIDDGFAALFTDLSCALGAVLLERHIVEDLLGCHLGHCYGHTFSNPVSRWAFQRALAQLETGGQRAIPGTMVYGNTTAYGKIDAQNYAAMAGYLGVDIAAQHLLASGHAVTPIPVSEARRIPDSDETIDACLFAARLMEHEHAMRGSYEMDQIDTVTDRLVTGAHLFFERTMAGLRDRGINTSDAVEMLLTLKRLGARRMERLYGPGTMDADAVSGRIPWVETPVIGELNTTATRILGNVADHAENIRAAHLTICVATTDVHEYGKILLEKVLREIGVTVIDGGVSTDPDKLAALADATGAQAIALSTYNGVALRFLRDLKMCLNKTGCEIPVYIGGKLNQIPDDSNTSLPVDVDSELSRLGAFPCDCVESMIESLAADQCGPR